MTALMEKALRRLREIPEAEQDQVARRVLDIAERAADSSYEASSLLSILSEPSTRTRSVAEINRDVRDLRDEWDS